MRPRTGLPSKTDRAGFPSGNSAWGVRLPRRLGAEFPGVATPSGRALLAPWTPRSGPKNPYAAARPPLASCQGVRIRGPAAVTAIVNSKWADSDPSWE